MSLVKDKLDGVGISLLGRVDFSFLSRYGAVFRAFDQQDSGNICFGVGAGADRVFVKVAGARTINYAGSPSEAVDSLRRAVPLYYRLRHPSLVELLEHYAVDELYVAAFRWVDGECLHAHWDFDAVPKYTDPRSPYLRFKALPLHKRLAALSSIFSFVQSTADAGYVAIDLYDGSLIYDFARDEVHICDIDFFQPSPYLNAAGSMWGSARFMSPEEQQAGSWIDEVTNVYTMGAIAFMALGDERSKAGGPWTAGSGLLQVAKRAVEPDRRRRYQSVAEFMGAWDGALRQP